MVNPIEEICRSFLIAVIENENIDINVFRDSFQKDKIKILKKGHCVPTRADLSTSEAQGLGNFP